jgi:hypothetical protein
MKYHYRYKILSMVLVLAMLSVIIAGASCASGNSGNNDTGITNNESGDAGSSEITAETDIFERLSIPRDTDFGGYAFNCLVYENANWGWDEIVAEEMTGETLNDAYYTRNTYVEDLLNIKITQTVSSWDTLASMFAASVQAGDNAYDAAFLRQQNAASCAMNDLCLDLNELDYVDLSKEWWDYHSIKDLTMAGKNYVVASDISVSDKDAIWVIYFDKQYIDDYKLESPYDLVDSGKWTVDKEIEMSKAVQTDLNGDGVYDKNDLWGLLTHPENYAASWMAAGEKLVTVNKDGIPVTSYDSERMNDVWSKAIELMKGQQTYTKDIGFISSGLRDGKTLFATEVVAFLRVYRANERDFGVLPMPKYDEAQESYNTYVAEGAGLLIVPKTADDFERTGIILETLAATGRDTILSAYYDVCLKSRDSRDEESGRMLDICFSTRCYDLGLMFDWGGVASTLKGGIDVFTRVTAAKGNLMEKAMKKSFVTLGIYEDE